MSRFSVPWKSDLPGFASMATPKNSPYHAFMQRFVLKHIEMGGERNHWKISLKGKIFEMEDD